jgi:membrane protein
VQSMLEALNKPTQGVVATVAGVGLGVVGATTVFGELQDAFDRIWRAPVRDHGGGVLSLLRTRLLSFSMIMGIGFLLMVSLVASAALAALGKWWAPMFGGWTFLASAVDLVLGFAVVTAGFALIYKVVPRVRIEWRDVWVGAAVTALLFTLGRFAIGFYLGRATFASAFGAAASLVVLLVWMYYSAQIFLLGAEFTWIYAHAFGSLSRRPHAGDGPRVPAPSMDQAVQALAASRTAIAAALRGRRRR